MSCIEFVLDVIHVDGATLRLRTTAANIAI
jgi:hypothetical protein